MASDPRHSGTFDKLFHHKHHDEHHEGEHGAPVGNHEQHSGEARPQHDSEFKRFDEGLKKEEKKFKNYLAKDEELEEEGKTYGGLM